MFHTIKHNLIASDDNQTYLAQMTQLILIALALYLAYQ